MFSVTPEAIAGLRANVTASNIEKLYAELEARANEQLKDARDKLQAGEDVREINITVRAEDQDVITLLTNRLRDELAQAGFVAKWYPDEEFGAFAVGTCPMVVQVLFT